MEKSRFEQDEEKKLGRFMSTLDELFAAASTVADRHPTSAGKLRDKVAELTDFRDELNRIRGMAEQERTARRDAVQARRRDASRFVGLKAVQLIRLT